MDKKSIEESANIIADAVIERLKKQGFISKKKLDNVRTSFQKTETLLYNYNNFKAAIRDKLAQIEDIKKSGAGSSSKSITMRTASQPSKNEAIIVEEKIEALERGIALTRHYIEVIDESLEAIKDDQYYDIIRLKYFEGLSSDDVADRLFVDTSTINRNKRRLVDILKIRLFSDEAIYEML